MAKDDTSIVLVEQVQSKILFLRGQKVILDCDLAALYGVPTKRLNEQIRRNHERFPPDFMFQLTAEEAGLLRSQFATSNEGRGGRRYKPYAFTEHGAIMAASVVNSERAVQASIYVVRAFVKLRQMLAPYKDLMGKLDQLEKKLQNHDGQIMTIIRAIKLLMPPPDEKPKEPFGFHPKKTSSSKGIY
jgi:hypothetical protein